MLMKAYLSVANGDFSSVLWILIRIRIDPHKFGCPGSGSVLGMLIRIHENGN